MHHPFMFRPDTEDEEVFHEVLIANTYGLPDRLREGALVVDIGANIGAFTYAALTRGAGEVHAFEADRANYEAARDNLRAASDRVHLRHAAVWRSDRSEGSLWLNHLDRFNTGRAHVLETGGGQPVLSVPLDDIIRTLTRSRVRRRIDLLKIDCEGSEYPILLTSRLLHRVDHIVGEFHNFASGVRPGHPFFTIPELAKVEGFERFTDAELIPHLHGLGFEVTVRRHEHVPHLLGTFSAVRPKGRLARLAADWRARRRTGLRQCA
jgi:FkbM family methyltransferase